MMKRQMAAGKQAALENPWNVDYNTEMAQKSTQGKGGEEKYLYDQAAFDQYMSTLPPTANPQIQRFKGLGEMMPAQLWSTTMDPSTRTLKSVSIEDAAQADRLFSMLMGDNVVYRKEFISNNADNLKLEDLDF